MRNTIRWWALFALDVVTALLVAPFAAVYYFIGAVCEDVRLAWSRPR